MSISNLVLAGLGLIEGIKENVKFISETGTTVDPVWKSKTGGTIVETPRDIYIIEENVDDAVTNNGIENTQVIEILTFFAVQEGEHFERPDGSNYQIFHYEPLPGASKEMYIAKASKVNTGKRT